MTKELFFINEPFEYKKGILVYPPTVKQVITIPMFNVYTKILTYSQEEIEDDFAKEGKTIEECPTPFEFLLNNSYHNKQFEQTAIQAFELFTRQKVSFLYDAKIIVFGDLQKVLQSISSLEDLVFLKEEEFFDFQNLIREAFGKKAIECDNPNEHPRIREMKRKARLRDRVKAKQASKDGLSFHSCLTSICCMGIGITPLNIGEMSYVAIDNILSRFQDKEKYQLDIDTLLAGGNSKKINPKYWIRNLEE